MRTLRTIVLVPLLALAGCQVISGLTGVTLDGERECQEARLHLKQCGANKLHVPANCDSTAACVSSCFNAASCLAIDGEDDLGNAKLNACLARCEVRP